MILIPSVTDSLFCFGVLIEKTIIQAFYYAELPEEGGKIEQRQLFDPML